MIFENCFRPVRGWAVVIWMEKGPIAVARAFDRFNPLTWGLPNAGLTALSCPK
jgi:hypothetical protein